MFFFKLQRLEASTTELATAFGQDKVVKVHHTVNQAPLLAFLQQWFKWRKALFEPYIPETHAIDLGNYDQTARGWPFFINWLSV